MLTDLRVRDLGVIEDVTLSLTDGMVALTGETGAGKTLVVEALSLVLGAKADPNFVRAGAAEALVEARFVRESEGGGDDEEIILARSVPVSGRSKAWIDGRMVTLSALAEAGALLVDIHGQRDHQSLLSSANQRRALDAFAQTDLGELESTRRQLSALEARLAALGGDPEERNREMDVLRHQVSELERAQWVDPDEDQRLREEELLLGDLEAHRAASERALAALDGEARGSQPGALDALGEALSALSGRVPFEDLGARLKGAIAEVDDVAHELRGRLESWNDDPDRLVAVQERRRVLAELRRKYGATFAAVQTFGRDAAQRLAELESSEEAIGPLEADRLATQDAFRAAEAAVRDRRREAAPSLARGVEARLSELAMPGAQLEVSVGETGSGEPVQFLLGANTGEALLSLSKVASGGELARAMLALRLVAMGGPTTMVFDEVDAGVGGQAALALARALREVATERQVIVVTHLAQVAAYAEQQVALEKHSVDGRTVTIARDLGDDDRVVEVSRMLSGHPDSDTARAHAQELLELGGTSTTAEGALD